MIKPFLRHWMLLDLNVFRSWATDERVRYAPLIDNKDGTVGRAFDVRQFPPEGLIAVSDTMARAMQSGSMRAIEPLPSCPERRLIPCPSLQELIERFGGYNNITEAAWNEYQDKSNRWYRLVQLGQAEMPDKLP